MMDEGPINSERLMDGEPRMTPESRDSMTPEEALVDSQWADKLSAEYQAQLRATNVDVADTVMCQLRSQPKAQTNYGNAHTKSVTPLWVGLAVAVALLLAALGAWIKPASPSKVVIDTDQPNEPQHVEPSVPRQIPPSVAAVTASDDTTVDFLGGGIVQLPAQHRAAKKSLAGLLQQLARASQSESSTPNQTDTAVQQVVDMETDNEDDQLVTQLAAALLGNSRQFDE